MTLAPPPDRRPAVLHVRKDCPCSDPRQHDPTRGPGRLLHSCPPGIASFLAVLSTLLYFPVHAQNPAGSQHADPTSVSTARNTSPSCFELRAGTITLDPASHRVESHAGTWIEWGDHALSASSAVIDLDRGLARLQGPVRWDSGALLVQASGATLDLEVGQISLTSCRLEWPRAGIRLGAAGGRWAPGTGLCLSDIRLVPCGCLPSSRSSPEKGGGRVRRPFLSVTARSALLSPLDASPGEHKEAAASPRLRLKSSVVRVLGVPVLYLPGWHVPLEPGSYSGPRAPRVSRNQDGVDIAFPWVWRTHGEQKLALEVGWLQRRGPWVNGGADYRGGDGEGEARLVVHGDRMPDTPPARWALTWRHDRPAGRLLGMHLDLDLPGDPNFLADFGNSVSARVDARHLSRLAVETAPGPWFLSTGLREQISTREGTFSHAGRVPEVLGAYSSPPRRMAGGTARLRLDWSAFRQALGNDTRFPVPGAPNEEARVHAASTTRLEWTGQIGHAAFLTGEAAYAIQVSYPSAPSDSAHPLFPVRHRIPLSAEMGTIMGRTFERPGHTWSLLDHEVTPHIRLLYDAWTRTDPGFLPPLGDPGTTTRRMVLNLSQHLFGARTDPHGAMRVLEIGTLEVALGKNVEAAGQWSDWEIHLEAQQPTRFSLSLLLAPDLHTASWAFAQGGIRFQGFDFQYGVGWLNPDRTPVPPAGHYPTPEHRGAFVDLQASLDLALLPGLVAKPIPDGLSIAAHTSFSLTDTPRPLTRRLELRYQPSPCACVGVYAYLALDSDRTTPEAGGDLFVPAFRSAGDSW